MEASQLSSSMKARKRLMVRAFKAGLSIEAVAWVFGASQKAVEDAIREALRE